MSIFVPVLKLNDDICCSSIFTSGLIFLNRLNFFEPVSFFLNRFNFCKSVFNQLSEKGPLMFWGVDKK